MIFSKMTCKIAVFFSTSFLNYFNLKNKNKFCDQMLKLNDSFQIKCYFEV